jgi:hypothetical protein
MVRFRFLVLLVTTWVLRKYALLVPLTRSLLLGRLAFLGCYAIGVRDCVSICRVIC